MIKCPKCKKESAHIGANVYVCRECKKILNPEQLLKFLKRLIDAIPPLNTKEYQDFVESIKKWNTFDKVLKN